MHDHTIPRPVDWREGRRLRAWELKQQGWTQQAIAEALGVTPGAVSQWMTRAKAGGVQALRRRPAPGPTPKLIDSALACPPERVPSGGFTDVEAGNVHRAAVDCLAWYDITSGGAAGRPADNYGPELQVRRGQMASFLVRVIDRVDPRLLPVAERDFSCPSDPGLALADSNPHADAIRRLAGAGVVDGGVGGRPADCFGPELDVRRDQMAAFLHRALELASGDRIRSETDAFDDDRGNPHESTINALTGQGLLAGKSFRVYDPSAPVRRDQMASFLTRKLSYLVDKDRTSPPR